MGALKARSSYLASYSEKILRSSYNTLASSDESIMSAAQVPKAPENNCRFDTFFDVLLADLKASSGAKSLVVVGKCPDISGLPEASIVYSVIDDAPGDSYFNCINYISKRSDDLQKISFTVTGMSGEKFKLSAYIESDISLSREQKRSISNKASTNLTNCLRTRVLSLRDYVVAMSLQTQDLSSFFHKAVTDCLREYFRFEGASAFYYDYQTNSLVLGATTGIPQIRLGGVRRADIKYHAESKSWVRKSFDTGKVLSEYAGKNRNLRRNTFGEDIANIENRLFMPIDVRASLKSRLIHGYGKDARASGRIGVIRIVNTRRNGFVNPLSEIDFHLLENFREYIAVLGARYVRVISVIHDQEKATHGFVTDLSTLRLRMQLFNYQFSDTIKRAVADSDPEKMRLAMLDLQALLTLFDRSFFAVQDGMAFQLQTVMQFADGVVGATGREEPICERPFVEVLVRVSEAASYVSSNYGRKESIVTFSGERRPSEAFIRMPSLRVPQKTIYLALRNLVENSIKYTKRTEIPRIDLHWYIDAENLVIEVSDQGIGISDSDVPALFREGFRARNALREATRGNGLGLCVSRRGLNAYGGEMMFVGRSKSGEGSIFSISLPLLK